MNKLITYAYLRLETDISQNVESSMLDNPIKWAQDQLKFLLGKEFYNEIETQGTTPTTTFDADNSVLFDPYIKQFLAWTAYADYIVKANSYEHRTGIRVAKEENSDPASDQDMNTRVKLAREKAQFYKGEMVNFILQEQGIDSTKYPLYKNDCNNTRFGTGFGISGVGKISTSQKTLTQITVQNGR